MRGSKTVVSDTDSSATQSDSSATKTDSDMIDGEDEEVSAPSPDSCPFSEGEKVLAFHETQIYEAKVLIFTHALSLPPSVSLSLSAIEFYMILRVLCLLM